MSRSTADCSDQKQKATKEKTCLSCEIPAFCRNHFYRGKLLTERDFSDEQLYMVNKLRLHRLALHGWGVVCGLAVKPHLNCPQERVVVEEGYAIDSCGREIRVFQHAYLELPEPPAPPAVKPATGEGTPAYRAEKPHALGSAVKRPELYREHSSLEEGDDYEENHPLPADSRDDTPKPRDLILCIRYAECETEFSPAPFDDCSCNGSAQRPNRVCESYQLEWHEHNEEFLKKVMHGECGCDNCWDHYHHARNECPEHECSPCLPLALVRDVVAGEPVKAEQIKNWEFRRQLVSTETLDKTVRCILSKLPTDHLTHIQDTNWEHNRRMLCHQFMDEYVGTQQRPKGFRIDFSHPVYSAPIDSRSFQAMIVFRPENMTEPKRVEFAPAHIHRTHDETVSCELRIDYSYAKRHLDGRNFDLFIILKCDVIRDRHDHAVDGNFIKHKLPTGDGIQGGTFESWIRVRPRPKSA
jgi:hypothetical protein